MSHILEWFFRSLGSRFRKIRDTVAFFDFLPFIRVPSTCRGINEFTLEYTFLDKWKEKSIQKEKRIKSKNFESNSVRFISVEIDKSIKYNNIKNILWKNEKENGREKEINSQVWRSICEGSLEQKEIVRRKYSKIRIIIGYLEKTNAACKNLIYREQVEFSRKKGSLLFRPITCASIIARPSRQTFNLSTRDAW